MKKKKILKNALMVLGSVLILISAFLALYLPLTQSMNAKKSKEIYSDLKNLMPEVQNGSFDDRVNVSMSALELNGENFIGIIEIPLYETYLPVAMEWDKKSISKYPHKFTGSIYDGSIIIGGSGNKGQFDFMKNITETDSVYFTDVTGMCYSYKVSKIEVVDSVTSEGLSSKDADLVLFAKDTFGSKYTVVSCKMGK